MNNHKNIMQTYISPNFTQDKLNAPNLDDLIDIYEDRIKNWVLKPANFLVSDNIFQVAGFCLLLTYFEGFWSYKTGQKSDGKSKNFFQEGFLDVFKPCKLSEMILKRIAEILYKDARCGFFHDGMFQDHIFFK